MTDRRSVIADCALPKHEAERLLAVAAGMTVMEVRQAPTVSADAVAEFTALVERRLGGEPLQYIEGTVPFGAFEIAVDDRVLIPRPETEELLVETIASTNAPKVIVDLCTGSGNLAAGLAHAYPEADVYATDISQEACDVAVANVRRLDLNVQVVCGSLFEPLPGDLRGRVDLIVSNPPYLSDADYRGVAAVVRSEPKVALVAGPEGTEVLTRIAQEAGEWLRPQGRLVCEIGSTQGPAALQIFAAYHPQIRRDMYGLDRFVVGAKPAE